MTPTKAIIWEELYAAHVRTRYFSTIAGKLKSRERWLAVSVAVLSSGAVTTIVANVPTVPLVLSLMTAIIGAILAAFKFDKGTAMGATLSRQWAEVASEYEILWAQFADLDEEEVLKRHRALLAKHFPADEVAIAEFPLNSALLDKCWNAVAASRGLEATTASSQSSPPVASRAAA